jgi:hypothetical protein
MTQLFALPDMNWQMWQVPPYVIKSRRGAFGQSASCFFSEQPSSQADSRNLDSTSDPFVFRSVGMGFSVGTGNFTALQFVACDVVLYHLG